MVLSEFATQWRYLGAVEATATAVAAGGAADEAVFAGEVEVVVVVVVVVVVTPPEVTVEVTVGAEAAAVPSIAPAMTETASAPSGTVPLGAFGSVVTSWNSFRIHRSVQRI